ncbi:hypothetical protein CDD81_7991 [Ophiocordyceps australis]|uniref:Uncharacterized protein n=1 Tax=Ophiocordyceps australis TaxID=1399860 RepID=A0A2C5Y466_9HYPO|nr:hypothetical protein CDD81_7991 [Ophiocordyceps australis]
MKLLAVVGLSFVLVAHALPGRFPRDESSTNNPVGVEPQAESDEWTYDSDDGYYHEDEYDHGHEQHGHSADAIYFDDSDPYGDTDVPAEPYHAVEWINDEHEEHNEHANAAQPASSQLRAKVAYKASDRPVIRRSTNQRGESPRDKSKPGQPTSKPRSSAVSIRHNQSGRMGGSTSSRMPTPERPTT